MNPRCQRNNQGLQETLLGFKQQRLNNPFFMQLILVGQPYLLAIGAPGALGMLGDLAEEPQKAVQRVAVAGGQHKEQQLEHSQLCRDFHG